MSWKTCKPIKPFCPSESEVGALLAKVEGVLGQLKVKRELCKKLPHDDRVKYWEERLADLKKNKIPMKDGKVDKEAWDKKPEDEKVTTWEELDAGFGELLCFNKDQLCVGKRYFVCFSILLLGMIVAYLVAHMDGFGQSKLSPQEVTDIWKKARLVEIRLGEIKAKEKEDQRKVSNAGQDLNSMKESLAKLQNKTQERGPLPLPFETSRLFAAVSAEIEKDDPAAHQTYQDFLKKLRADLESFSTAYFWTTPPRRWFELAWWAAIGSLVGLLFYIAGSLKEGIFKPEEGVMFWTEVLIAPIVVPVVFFLFTFTDITSFVPSEASLVVNIGVSFIFGFAIRRTVGLLDTIKKRFFPDPSPGASSPGS